MPDHALVTAAEEIADFRHVRPHLSSELEQVGPHSHLAPPSDPSIKKAWEVVRAALQDALGVTIFGYSAPASDKDAVSIMQDAWGNPEKRQFEAFEIIDIKPREEVRANWRGFVYSDHYRIYTNLRDSMLVRHPRRSGEAFLNQYIDGKFLEGNPVVEAKTLDELHNWFRPLFEVEQREGVSTHG